MITKRQLGLALLGVGLAAVVSVLAIDLVGVGQYSGVGPVQRLALAAGGIVVIVGVSLIPFGNRPA